MTYRVRITPTALADAEKFYLWIVQNSPVHAANWFNGLFGAIDTLAFMPSRCAMLVWFGKVSLCQLPVNN